MRIACTAAALLAVAPALAQEDPSSRLQLRHRIEIRANYRDSDQERFRLRFRFPPEFLPPGETAAHMETVDAGRHFELSVASVQLDLTYRWFTARAKIHAVDKYRRNPTSSDRTIDADELFIRFGENPEFLGRPERTSFLLQIGKAPKMERQPIRLLESYGLAATAFNRFEDTQALIGGTVGRNFYWRLQLANGNPLFFRDPNALAGDNGTPELRQPGNPNPTPDLKSGFPILYNAEVESLFFEADHLQFGQALGYRWQRDDQSFGYDLIVFHYRRELADEVDLTGTFYGGDLDLLDGPLGVGLPLSGRKKQEYGARGYVEWHGLTGIAQFTKQHVAGLQRQAYEIEAGYQLQFGPVSIQPAARWSELRNRFVGDPVTYPAPSVWWNWTKLDAGVRVGFPRNIDVTIERAIHEVEAPRILHPDETLVTLRVRL